MGAERAGYVLPKRYPKYEGVTFLLQKKHTKLRTVKKKHDDAGKARFLPGLITSKPVPGTGNNHLYLLLLLLLLLTGTIRSWELRCVAAFVYGKRDVCAINSAECAS